MATVRNTGGRPRRDVVQVYGRRLGSDRPERLIGFRRVAIGTGETAASTGPAGDGPGRAGHRPARHGGSAGHLPGAGGPRRLRPRHHHPRSTLSVGRRASPARSRRLRHDGPGRPRRSDPTPDKGDRHGDQRDADTRLGPRDQRHPPAHGGLHQPRDPPQRGGPLALPTGQPS